MGKLTYKDLLDNGAHFGHLTRKWDPRMAPYIFMEKNGIHIIDLNKTLASLEVAQEAIKLNMPYATERWLGGMLTNFTTVRKSLKKMSTIEKMTKDESFKSIAKRERLMLGREKEKLERVLGGIADLTRLPAALFIVDTKKEHIAVAEAHRLGIPVFGICDTNCNPDAIDYPIPANDDAFKSINVIVSAIGEAIIEGLEERKKAKEEQKLQEQEDDKIALDEDDVKVPVITDADDEDVKPKTKKAAPKKVAIKKA